METAKFNQRTTTQLLLAAIQFLWMYDYLLTLEDEVRSRFSPERYRVLIVAKITYPGLRGDPGVSFPGLD